ncbi:MAE_28990/MAE_18760 family HEPN-like nuclease [Streptomyces coeruleorubidus]|uniref:MAE_28990/MAE_18760 family HEPN-like nuclease n=1 Tax=Streptomyces coeruleorubidus TaxID=116188 RepID=UPI003674F48D
MSTKLASYDDFINSTAELHHLLAVRPASPLVRRTDEAVQLENAVHRACLVLLVAHFEGFAKAALSEYVDEVCAVRPPARKVPPAFLELFTRDRIQEIASLPAGVDRVHRTRKLFTAFSALWDQDRSIDPQVISAKILARQMTSLKPDVLRESFSLIGIDDIIADATSNLQTAGLSVRVDIKLEEIVDKRNLIAHGDYSIKPTSTDLEDYIDFFMAVGDAFSRSVVQAIDQACTLRSPT